MPLPSTTAKAPFAKPCDRQRTSRCVVPTPTVGLRGSTISQGRHDTLKRSGQMRRCKQADCLCLVCFAALASSITELEVTSTEGRSEHPDDLAVSRWSLCWAVFASSIITSRVQLGLRGLFGAFCHHCFVQALVLSSNSSRRY